MPTYDTNATTGQPRKSKNVKREEGIVLTRIILALSFVVCGVHLAYADPTINSVSGALRHKGTTVISGYNFGTKVPAAPLRWEDCESHANNVDDHSYCASQFDQVGPWYRGCGEWSLMFKNSRSNRWIEPPHTRSQIIVGGGHKDNYPVDDNCSNVGIVFDAGSGKDTWFLMWYERWSPDFPYNAPADGWLFNAKAGEFGTGSTMWSGQICQVWGLFEKGNPGGRGDFCTGYCNECGGTISGRGEKVIDDIHLGWRHLEVRIDRYKGIAAWMGDNKFSMNANCAQSDLPIFSDSIRHYYIGGWMRWYYPRGTNTGVYHLCDNAWRYFDDMYVDNSLARVMLANDSNYARATVVEPQIPSAWNDNSITVMVNLGRLPDSGTAYLFVFDADNNRNPVGYPVSIEGGSNPNPNPPAPPPPPDTTPPAPPTGLEIKK